MKSTKFFVGMTGLILGLVMSLAGSAAYAEERPKLPPGAILKADQLPGGKVVKVSEMGFDTCVYEGVVCYKGTTGDMATVLQIFQKKGAIPAHRHVFEQITYMIKGKAIYRSGDKEFLMETGDMAVSPPFADHSFEALEDSHMLEIFSPARKELLESSD